MIAKTGSQMKYRGFDKLERSLLLLKDMLFFGSAGFTIVPLLQDQFFPMENNCDLD